MNHNNSDVQLVDNYSADRGVGKAAMTKSQRGEIILQVRDIQLKLKNKNSNFLLMIVVCCY